MTDAKGVLPALLLHVPQTTFPNHPHKQDTLLGQWDPGSCHLSTRTSGNHLRALARALSNLHGQDVQKLRP